MQNSPPTIPPNFDGDRSTDLKVIKRKSIRSGTITLATQGASAALQLVSTVVMARVLGPAEYGVIAMVTAITAFADLFRDLGLSSSTIQRDKLSREQLSTLFWINVAAGTTLTLIVAAASPLVAKFYERPELTAVTLWLSLKFLLSSLSTQQGALLTRQMRFGRKAIATLSGSATTLTMSVSLAVNDHGYWALVFGSLTGSLVTTIMLNVFSGWRPGPPVRGTGIRSMLKYGANITGFDLVNYFHRNLDNILIGRFWGTDALGLYNRAYQLLLFPISNLRGPINAVAFPAMSRLQNEPVSFRLYYRKVTGILAFVSMPLTSFLFVASEPVIELALGSKWLGVVPIFSVLAIVSFIQPVASLRGLVLLSLGQGPRYFTWGVINAVCVSIGFFIGVRWGPIGVAISYCITVYAILYPSMAYVFKKTPISSADFSASIARPLISSLLATLLMKVADTLYWGHLSSPSRICFLLPSFFLLYLAGFMVLPAGAAELRSMLQLAKSGIRSR